MKLCVSRLWITLRLLRCLNSSSSALWESAGVSAKAQPRIRVHTKFASCHIKLAL